VTRRLERQRVSGIVICGVGGAYPDRGLPLGDVVSAESECYGDLGADSPDGFLDMQALGFPLVEHGAPLYNTFPMQLFPTTRRVPFVTVNTCTGRDDAMRLLQARTGGGVENMEGAAIAHVAHLYGIPVGEVRGISNLVGRRDRSAWKLADAARAAQEALLAWLATC
jgi:futalosine hydrolase